MASALGAVCIEKHFTIDKSLGLVPDHAISVDGAELHTLTQNCARGAVLRGSANFGVSQSELPARTNARRSIVASRPLFKGDRLELDDLAYKRPGTGLAPQMADSLIGRTMRCNREPDELLTLDDVE